MLSSALIVSIVALAISWALVRVTREFARNRGWVAPVRDDRWHAQATPLFGGVAITVAFLCAIAGARGTFDSFRDATSANASLAIALIVGAVGAAITGLCDDIFHFRPSTKLAAQCGCSCAFLWIAGGISITGSAPVDSVLCLLWIVTVMNAVNMLDNMDGVASTALLIGFAGVAWMNATAAPGSFVFVVAVAAAGVTAGFLAQNLPRARIFMGDAGSLFLGYLLAALVLICTRPLDGTSEFGTLEEHGGWRATAAIALACAFVPLLDLGVVSIMRLRRGVSPLQGGRDHTTHRLSQLRVSDGHVVWIVAGVSAAVVVIAVIVSDVASPLVAVAVLAALFVLLGALLLRMCIRMDGAAHLQWATIAPFVKVVIDLVTIAAVLNAGYLLRWDFVIPAELTNSVAWSLPVALACCVGANALRGEYLRSWSWSGASTRPALVSALLGAGLAVVVIAALWSPERLFSRAAMGIFLVGYPVTLGLVRVAIGWVVR